MNKKVLFVDDEVNVLNAYKRALRKQFAFDVASGGEEALEKVSRQGPYAVIVSDMRMPGMTGVELLSAMIRKSPDTVRIMLTGNSDQQTAIDAVNKGDIFRFLNKPCPPEDLAHAISAGLEQHRLVTAEKELLQKTLSGSIQVLVEILSLVNPEAFGQTPRLRKYMRLLAAEVGLADAWWLEPLVLLSQIGCVILPKDVLKKLTEGYDLSGEEQQLFEQHPCIGSDLLAKIPRMEKIAESIKYQEKCFSGEGIPKDSLKGKEIPIGARMLKLVLDLERMDKPELDRKQLFARLKRQGDRYDPELLKALERVVVGVEPKVKTQDLTVRQLRDGMVLAEDVKTTNGLLIVCKDQEVTPSVRHIIGNFLNNGVLREPLKVVKPEG